VLTDAVGANLDFDTKAQFAVTPLQGGTCEFIPPGNVYDEGWGGIDGVRWEPNTWGSTSLSEIRVDCADASDSCLLLSGFANSGLHVTYRHPFPTRTFATLSLQLRTTSGTGTVEIAPRSEDARCTNPKLVELTNQFARVQLDIATSCTGTDAIVGFTISRSTQITELVLDEIRFE
jgi:hypothetical protein